MDPHSPLQTPPPGSPFRPVPEQPRLGIIHLMVWTACVAVYFSINRLFYPDELLQTDPLFLVFWVGEGIVLGAALGGLLLFVARRCRGLPFPTQPGEMLLVLSGVNAAMYLLLALLFLLIREGDGPITNSTQLIFHQAFALLTVVVLGVLHLIVIVRTKIPRWRLYFITVVVTYVLANSLLPLLPAAFMRSSGRWMVGLSEGTRLLPLAVGLLPVLHQPLKMRAHLPGSLPTLHQHPHLHV